jgi:histidinol-phosphatase
MKWIPLLKKLANASDTIALKYFNKVDLKVDYKNDNSPVSEADKEIEAVVRELIGKSHPDLGIYGEEYGEDALTELRLIIDPIDGTRNFVRGVPIFATLLAIEEKGKIIAGLVSAPALKTRWWAEQNQGAHMENKITKIKKPIFVSQINTLSHAQLFHASLSGNEIRDTSKETLLKVVSHTERQRGFGDFYQHVLVAQGSGEAAYDPHVKPWDIAPLKIILEEAGGKLTSFNGKDSIYEGNCITTNGLVHDELLEIIH